MASTRLYAIAGGSAALALTAGLLVWWNVSGDPAIGIPSKVCQNALPSTDLKELFPSKGKAFEEDSTTNGFVVPAKPLLRAGGGTCYLSAGGEDMSVKHYALLDGIAEAEKSRLGAAKLGPATLTLGKAKGTITTTPPSATLYVDCPFPAFKDPNGVVKISILISAKKADESTLSHLAAFTADVTRIVTQDILGCEGADALPDGPAKAGATA
ncbi:hypothetical protein ACGFY7_25980 [Streptomyces prunicolor]|uniref:hypothetical protein n=1 Tax=Streptomyces prunicolor TaxID=67348 RepID=UPI00372042C4